MKEQWKDIENFEGYKISDSGRVKSYVNNRHGIGSKSHILKPTVNKLGYESVCLGRGNRRLIHRLVAAAYIPNPNNLPLVRHLDDNPRNNNVSNLAWGTQLDNMHDCVSHGRLVGDTTAAVEANKQKVIATSIDGKQEFLFSSASEAARTLNVWKQHITHVIYGRIRQTGGWTFRYANEKEDV